MPHVVDAYVKFCENNDFRVPSEKMQAILKTKRRLNRMEVNPANVREVHRIRRSIVKMRRSEDPPGFGDKFDAFCASHGRVRPTEDQVTALNADPFIGAQTIRTDPTNPKLYTALSTFKAHGGMRNVRPL